MLQVAPTLVYQQASSFTQAFLLSSLAPEQSRDEVGGEEAVMQSSLPADDPSMTSHKLWNEAREEHEGDTRNVGCRLQAERKWSKDSGLQCGLCVLLQKKTSFSLSSVTANTAWLETPCHFIKAAQETLALIQRD